MCLVRRFWGDSAEQAKKCSTASVRPVASGFDQSYHPNWVDPDATDQPGSEPSSSPRPEWERCGEGRTGGREKLYHVG